MGLACISGGKECTGCGDCRVSRRPRCPVCGEELNFDDTVYTTGYRDIIGCQNCIDTKNAEDVFPYDD